MPSRASAPVSDTAAPRVTVSPLTPVPAPLLLLPPELAQAVSKTLPATNATMAGFRVG
jgi:hypothetical protein